MIENFNFRFWYHIFVFFCAVAAFASPMISS